MTLDDIFKWAPDNEDVFNEIYVSIQKSCIAPFVGAGMSAPVYPLWKSVLIKLTDKLSSEAKKKEVYSILNDQLISDAYTKAADKLIELRTVTNVTKDLLKIYNEDRINDSNLSAMSVYLLPLLFPNMPVLTTNYDRILEHVYRLEKQEFDSTFGPDSDLAVMAGQQNLHCLFKIHGDIGREVLDSRKLILSGESYNRVYKPDSEVVNTLKAFYKGKMMLFLGCSLKNDRTLDVLTQVSETEMVSHYAILPASKESIDDETCFYGNRGIRAIYYDPEHHESVKTILEELLRITDPDKFRHYKSLVISDNNLKRVENPFVYNAGVIDFFGRSNELRKLKEFAEADGDFEWWAIIGEGGAGKTRLAYEFTNFMRKEGWNVEWIRRDDLKDINNLNRRLTLGRKNIIVADYGQSFARELGKWMVGLVDDIINHKNTCKIRVLIIDREQKDRIGSLVSSLSEDDYNGRLKSYHWGKDFLELKPLDESSTKEILRSYALYREHAIDEPTVNSLIVTLENIDPDFKRPLYAMFIADAYCENEDPTQWDRENILEWVTDREEKLISKRIEECTGQVNKKQKEALSAIRFIATINENISLDEIADNYIEQWEKYENAYENTATGCSLIECLKFAGIVEDGVIKAIRPDLLGEFYVLIKFERYKDLFLLNGWTENENLLSFVFRFNFYYGEKEEIVRSVFKMLKDAVPTSENAIILYAMIIVNITATLDEEEDLTQAVQLLKDIYKYNEVTALAYAQGLANQCLVMPTDSSIEELCRISEEYDGHEEIALVYAKGLSNYTHSQTANKQEIVNRLGKLSEKYNNGEIAWRYAFELAHLCQAMPLKERKEGVHKLKELSDRYEGNEEIAIICANSINNLILYQSIEEKKKSVELLKELSNLYEGNEEIASSYANSIVNLINKQPLQEERCYIERLRRLSEKFEESIEINIFYARGLFNISLDYPNEERKRSVNNLKKLCNKYQDEEIAFSYARVLVNLTYGQPELKAENAVEKLKELSENFEHDNRIALEYAYGLVNLLNKQSLEMAGESVRKLQELSNKYEGNADIAVEYAYGLYKLTIDQPLNGMQKNVYKLKGLSEKYRGNKKIYSLYDEAMENLKYKNPLILENDY